MHYLSHFSLIHFYFFTYCHGFKGWIFCHNIFHTVSKLFSQMQKKQNLLNFSPASFQGWEFAHLISERNARFLSKNERMSDSLKKISDSLIRSFLVSEMSDWLTSLISSERPERIVHGRSFLVSQMSDLLTSLISSERPERFAHITHQKRGNERK